MIKLTDKKIIGLIGMSGAGKSTVCRRFSESGFTVIDCDISAREVAEVGTPSLKELAAELSPDVIREDGSLDRQLTSRIIFNDDKKRAIFNRIIYPYITYNVMCKIKAAENDVLLDAPTLFDARLEGICDSIVSVCADSEVCIQRIMKRDSIDRALAAARLSAQHEIDWYRQRSDYCIVNNDTQEILFKNADDVIGRLKGN